MNFRSILFRFFCRRSAIEGTPDQGEDANECPVGYFCPEGTAEPEQCPPGTYSDQVMLASEDECTNCTKGKVSLVIFSPYTS